MKNLLFIRHGKSSHNLDYQHRGEKAYLDVVHTDSSLIEEGFKQCKEIMDNNSIFFNHLILENDYIIVVSPLRRCITTALLIFADIIIPKDKILCYEYIREYPCGLHTPNKRIAKSSLEYFFDKYINFDNITSEKDIYWNTDRVETLTELDKRIFDFKEWIKNRKESNIIIISHASFIGRFIFNDTNYPIEHKKNYKFILE